MNKFYNNLRVWVLVVAFAITMLLAGACSSADVTFSPVHPADLAWHPDVQVMSANSVFMPAGSWVYATKPFSVTHVATGLVLEVDDAHLFAVKDTTLDLQAMTFIGELKVKPGPPPSLAMPVPPSATSAPTATPVAARSPRFALAIGVTMTSTFAITDSLAYRQPGVDYRVITDSVRAVDVLVNQYGMKPTDLVCVAHSPQIRVLAGDPGKGAVRIKNLIFLHEAYLVTSEYPLPSTEWTP